jgi:hypothetical protein
MGGQGKIKIGTKILRPRDSAAQEREKLNDDEILRGSQLLPKGYEWIRMTNQALLNGIVREQDPSSQSQVWISEK